MKIYVHTDTELYYMTTQWEGSDIGYRGIRHRSNTPPVCLAFETHSPPGAIATVF